MGGGNSLFARVFDAVGSGGVSELARTKPFQSGGKAGTFVPGIAKDTVGVVTGGVVDAHKGRVNAPYTSGAVRGLAKSYGNAATGGTQRESINAGLDTKEARLAGTALGVISAGGAGAIAGPSAGVSLSAADSALLAGSTAAAAGTGDVQRAIKPPPIEMSQIELAAKRAANAVQTADAEGRRARNAKRQSSALSSYQARSQINAATLQPAQPRRSVLG